jgi:competence protein ComEC
LYYGALAGWLVARHLRQRRGSSAWIARRVQRIASLCFVFVLAWILAGPLRDDASWPLLVRVFDVGQGDSAMVRLPDGRALLIDAGGSPFAGRFDIGARILAPALWASGVGRIDYLAITHGDPDHMGGAASLVRDFKPREIWQGVSVPNHLPTRALKETAFREHAAWRTLVAGESLQSGRATIDVWHPGIPDWERITVRNDDSLVFDIRLGDVSLVFTGDIGSEVEHQLLARIAPATIRVLKVPHHGSLTSSSEEFLRALKPDIAIFTVGRHNRFGHPHPIVLERYRRLGIQIFRTDEDGMITVRTDRRSVHIETYQGRTLRLDKGR